MVNSRKQASVSRILFIALLVLIAMLSVSFRSDALTGMEARGEVKVSDGAIVRAQPTTESSRLAVLRKGANVEVRKIFFTHDTKRSST